ncbi:MAG: ATP-dependent protease, partial [Burkholderiales bacterium]
DLMLRADVVEAVADGKFSVHAIATVDQAMALLTGVPAGQPDAEGRVPEGTVNYKVAARLEDMSQTRQAFAASADKAGHAAQAGTRGGSGDQAVDGGVAPP